MNHLIDMNSDTCTGCSACVAVCPKNAVSMLPDKRGFLVPVINEATCIGCGACVTVCQTAMQGVQVQKYQHTAYAAQHKDDEIRHGSSSGAFFQAIAEAVIEKDGYVCGCVLEDMRVRHIVTNRLEDVRRMADSKYVQSDMRDCYRQIEALLKKGSEVLFSGCSCQVMGLKLFLQHRKTPFEHLISIDFFCHGVPSPRIWSDYIAEYERKKRKKVVGYRFRGKDFGWGKKGQGKEYDGKIFLQNGTTDARSFQAMMWPNYIFGVDAVLRKNCYSCRYACVEKPADFTMGDFWGIENTSVAEMDDGKGTSVVIAHNDKAREFLFQLTSVDVQLVSIEEAVRKQPCAARPTPQPDNYNAFWSMYLRDGFKAVNRRFFRDRWSYRLKRRIKLLLIKIGLF